MSKGDDPGPWRSRVADLTGLRGARLNPGWQGLRALTIAALVAAVISGMVGWRSRPHQGAPPVTPAPRGTVLPTSVPSAYFGAGPGELRRAESDDLVPV